MEATAERREFTSGLIDELEEVKFPNAAQLDRIERLITSREELEDYIAILMRKAQGSTFPGQGLLDRIERLLRVLQRVDQET